MPITFTINERGYELVAVDKLSFSDQRKLKRFTGGMNLGEISKGLGVGDVDACFGVILMSVQKQNPLFTEDDLNKLDMLEVLRSFENDAEEDAVPPPVADTLADSPPAPSGETRPETTGTPALLTGSA